MSNQPISLGDERLERGTSLNSRMTTWISLCLTAVVALVSVGCALGGGYRARPFIPLDLEGVTGFRYVGDSLSLKTITSTAPFNMKVSLIHRASQQVTVRHFSSAETTTVALPIDVEHLAGLDLQGAAVQPFDVMVEATLGEQGGASTMITRTEFWVVLDREARMPAGMPLGKVPFIGGLLPGQEAVEDTEELARMVIKEWEGTDLCVTSQVRTAEELTPTRPLWEPIPAGITLREFMVYGTFPKRIVQGTLTEGSGDMTVTTPKSLRFVIAQSKPSRLVSLQVANEAELPPRETSGCQ